MKFKSLLATGLMVAGLSTSAFAQELSITPYVSGWFNSFATMNTTKTTGSADKENDTFVYNISEASTAGVLFESGNFTGEFTIKASSEFLKRAYVTYNFEDGEALTVGMTETLAWYNFGQVSGDYNALINYGALSDTVRPMALWSGFGTNLAIIANGITVNGKDTGIESLKNNGRLSNVEVEQLPRVEVSYDIESDMFNGVAFASYSPFYASYDIGSKTEESTIVNAYSVGIGGQFTQGDFFADVTAYYGINLGLTGNLDSENAANMAVIAVNAAGTEVEVEDSTAFGGAIGVGYVINDMYTPSVGFGYATASIEGTDSTSYAVYANVNIALYDWLTLTPEIAYTSKEMDYKSSADTTETAFTFGLISEFAF